MTLNELNKFARIHNIDFNKDILCINTINDNLVLNNLEQIAVKDIDNLVFIPSSLAYNACTIRDFKLCDTVNSVDLPQS